MLHWFWLEWNDDSLKILLKFTLLAKYLSLVSFDSFLIRVKTIKELLMVAEKQESFSTTTSRSYIVFTLVRFCIIQARDGRNCCLGLFYCMYLWCDSFVSYLKIQIASILWIQVLHNTEVSWFSMPSNYLKNDHFDKTSYKMS